MQHCTLSVLLEASEGHCSERGNASELGSVGPAPPAELDVEFLIRQEQEKILPLLSGCCAGYLSCCCTIARRDAPSDHSLPNHGCVPTERKNPPVNSAGSKGEPSTLISLLCLRHLDKVTELQGSF